MKRRADPRDLQLLSHVRRYKSLVGAAEKLGLSAPTVTRKIAKAEQNWGLRLVDRSPRGAELTAFGHALADRGEVIDSECMLAVDNIASLLGSYSRRLRIGAFQGAASRFLPDVLEQLWSEFDDADITVLPAPAVNPPAAVSDGDLDLVLFSTYGDVPLPQRGVNLHHLMDDPLYVVVPDSHRIAQIPEDKSVSLGSLKDEDWAVIVEGQPVRTQFDNATKQAGFRPRVRFETQTYHVAQALVSAGKVITFVSLLSLGNMPGTAARRLDKPIVKRDVWLASASTTNATPLVASAITRIRAVTSLLSDCAP